ncbi:MAG: hypothetical protein JW943_15000 [Deltaproteobacteria bacterium]|nr:hypothetical protein [Deltaproteobacteria bacterium]
MKKDREAVKGELRAEYKRSDFPEGLVREQYSKRMRESSNIVVLKPEVAQAFPNGDAVNNALLSLIKIAKKSAGLTKANAADVKKRTADQQR